jgi:hypothetical protein
MRKFMVAVATAGVLSAGSLAWKADATTPLRDPGVVTVANNFSLVVKAACGQPGPLCRPGRHWVCGPRHCWCAPC